MNWTSRGRPFVQPLMIIALTLTCALIGGATALQPAEPAEPAELTESADLQLIGLTFESRNDGEWYTTVHPIFTDIEIRIVQADAPYEGLWELRWLDRDSQRFASYYAPTRWSNVSLAQIQAYVEVLSDAVWTEEASINAGEFLSVMGYSSPTSISE